MTKVEIFKDKRDNIKGYIVKGHAEYGEYGEDIVCAAISVLSQTALLSLNKVCNIDEADIEFKLEEGYLEVMLLKDIDAKLQEKANIVLNTMLIGLESVKEEYSDFITLKYREVE